LNIVYYSFVVRSILVLLIITISLFVFSPYSWTKTLAFRKDNTSKYSGSFKSSQTNSGRKQDEHKAIEDIKSIDDLELLSKISVRSNRINEATEARFMDLWCIKSSGSSSYQSNITKDRRRRRAGRGGGESPN
jgi:hypothetical protein